jgi:hypothetical protein
MFGVTEWLRVIGVVTGRLRGWITPEIVSGLRGWITPEIVSGYG